MGRSAIRVTVDELDTALRQTLTLWHQDVNDAIDAASERAVKVLVTKTRATAPTGHRGKFKRSIASKEVTRSRGQNRGKTYAWYVKAPDHRLTHLVVHGHAKRNGGRTKGNSFLQDALNAVLPEYEAQVEEAIRSGHK